MKSMTQNMLRADGLICSCLLDRSFRSDCVIKFWIDGNKTFEK